MIPLCFLEVVSLHTLTPRIILSMRALYTCDVQGRHSGEIDNGFGLSKCSSGHNTRGTTSLFRDVELKDEMDGNKEVSSEDGAIQPE